MNILDVMTANEGYCARHTDTPLALQDRAKLLCWQYNQTRPDEGERRAALLRELFGDCHPLTFIEPSFRCDYGFNIHTHGLTVINYNCVILDTSPVHIGENAFIAPGSASPARGMRWTRRSVRPVSAPRAPSRSGRTCGLARTPRSAVV